MFFSSGIVNPIINSVKFSFCVLGGTGVLSSGIVNPIINSVKFSFCVSVYFIIK